MEVELIVLETVGAVAEVRLKVNYFRLYILHTLQNYHSITCEMQEGEDLLATAVISHLVDTLAIVSAFVLKL